MKTFKFNLFQQLIILLITIFTTCGAWAQNASFILGTAGWQKTSATFTYKEKNSKITVLNIEVPTLAAWRRELPSMCPGNNSVSACADAMTNAIVIHNYARIKSMNVSGIELVRASNQIRQFAAIFVSTLLSSGDLNGGGNPVGNGDSGWGVGNGGGNNGGGGGGGGCGRACDPVDFMGGGGSTANVFP
jgi:uncharacterized membrane protein YgcG